MDLTTAAMSKWALLSLFLLFFFGYLLGWEGGRAGNRVTFPQNVIWLLGVFLFHSQHEPDTKFILILDRRLDTWTSVKMTLQKIAVSPL